MTHPTRSEMEEFRASLARGEEAQAARRAARRTYRIPSYVTETLYVLEAEIARGEDVMAAMLRTVSEGN